MRAVCCILFTSLLLFVSGCGENPPEARLQASVRTDRIEPPVKAPPAGILAAQQAFIEVSSRVTPSVVNIRAARRGRAPELGPLFEDFFGELFRGAPRRERQEQSLGSGFILSADGYILTNEHVIKGAEEIKVKLSDGRTYDGTVVGSDPSTDVAVLKIEPGGELPAAVLGDSDALQVGQWALAIGNPFGLDRTLTVGVISATGRANVGIEDYEDFIQTDASINPGNSGGPLLNVYGEVVGVNTAIVASGQGIGFAIPINLAKLIADQLIETGEVTRGWLGVSIQPLTPELAESFDLDKVTGALVNRVMPGTPAEKAGVRRGDILLRFAGKEVRGVRALQLLVASSPAGKAVALEVLRDGERLTLEVTPTARNEEAAAAAPQPGRESDLGLTVAPADGEGVRVEAVDPESAAAAGGVRPGDLILSLNRRPVPDLEAFREAARERSGDNVVLLLRRGETTLYLAFPAP